MDDNVVRRKHNMSMFHFQPEIPENFDGNSLNYEERADIKIMNQSALGFLENHLAILKY